MTNTLINCDLEAIIRRKGWTVTDAGCWEWTGNTFHTFGYGQFRLHGKGYDAHRAAYTVWKGDPIGQQVRHTCDNPPCINPDHLVLGSSQDNHDDMVKRGRALKGARNPRAKLSQEDVDNIRILYGMGASQGQIGKAYGVSQPTVSVIVRGIRW